MKILNKLPESVQGMEIHYCDDCPFFDNGAGYEYGHVCQIGASSGNIVRVKCLCYDNKSTWETNQCEIPRDCPLQDA